MYGDLLATARAAPDRDAPTGLQNTSSSLNASTAGTNDLAFTLKFLVFPQTPNKVNEIQSKLYQNIHSGTVQRFESHLRPAFHGVEFWVVYATLAEIVAVSRLLGNDVSNIMIVTCSF